MGLFAGLSYVGCFTIHVDTGWPVELFLRGVGILAGAAVHDV
jgi:hypothetical protein